MLELLLLVIGCYAVAALLVHLAFKFGGERKRTRKHYVLIADGRQPRMEWYLRSLHSFSRRTGNDIQLTVVDHGLEEESKAIVDRWNRGSHKVRLHAMDGKGQAGQTENLAGGDKALHWMWYLRSTGIVTESDQAILVDLQNPEDLSKMPF